VFRWGVVLRLRVGQYRMMYTVEGDLVTILRPPHGSGIGLGAQMFERATGI
jgi:hypothetical protein